MTSPPRVLRTLVGRYDRTAFEPPGGRARVRLAVAEGRRMGRAARGRRRAPRARRRRRRRDAHRRCADVGRRSPTTSAAACAPTRSGRLAVRRNLHLGVGLPGRDERRRRARALAVPHGRARAARGCRRWRPAAARRSLAMHGLGGTKGSFLPTVAALAGRLSRRSRSTFRASATPTSRSARPTTPRFFADAVIDLLDALELDRAHLIGNSLGGRVALEVGLRHPERVGRLALLAPSLAWRRDRPWAPLLRLVRPELGLVQLAPRAGRRGRSCTASSRAPTTAGRRRASTSSCAPILTPAGRAAFYAAARQIYLEEPHGEEGFWPRLRGARSPTRCSSGAAATGWCRSRFARHVAEALPRARHLELDCGHVPQIERPAQTHAAIGAFLREDAPTAR